MARGFYMEPFPGPSGYNGAVSSGRPEYKNHPLWIEAMALTRSAYTVADGLAPTDADGARGLRKAAVSVPALVAGALSGEQADSRAADAAGACAALDEVANRASRIPGPVAAELVRQSGALEDAVRREFRPAGSLVC
jgi:hypothetical protein